MKNTFKQLDLWYKTPLGRCVLETEYAALTPYLQDCFGCHVLQMGGPSDTFLFHPNPIFHTVRLSTERHCAFRGPSVRGVFEALPFLPESIDLVLLPHILEFAEDPSAVLAESFQVLAPEGRLIVVGFNACSLWGLSRYLVPRKTPAIPWQGHFFMPSSIKKHLLQQGFVVEEMRSLFFRPPVTEVKSLQRWLALEALGRLLWGGNGGIYLIVARKQVTPLTTIRESPHNLVIETTGGHL
jgi:SAM-dependent methyltransferase